MSRLQSLACGVLNAAVNEETNERSDSEWFHMLGYAVTKAYYNRHRIQLLIWKYTDVGESDE